MNDQLLAERPGDALVNTKRGTRPPGKRTCRVEFWTTPEQLEAIRRLDNIGTLNRADHLRRATEMYLEYIDRQGAKHG